MKITFLLTQDIESPSGLGRYYPLAKGLVRCGHTVTIIALHPDYDNLSEKRFSREGVAVWYVGQSHVRKSGSSKTYFSPIRLLWITLKGTWSLTKAALSSRSDLIHIGKPHPMNSLAARLTKLIQHKIVYLDCDDYEAASGKFSGRWQKSIVSWFEKWTPTWVDWITTNTIFTRDLLCRWGTPAEHITYIPNGFDSDRFKMQELARIGDLQNRLGIEGKRIILYIGSMSLASHPVDLLVTAFRIVHSNYPGSLLLIVGGGEDLDSLQDLVHRLELQDDVIFTGRINPEQVVMYYHLGDVSVDPVNDDDQAKSRSPLKLFESWAAGVPFVTAAVGDRTALLGSPQAGVLANPGDPESLASAILSILNNPENAKNLSRLGLERVGEYDWYRLAEKLDQTYPK